MSFGELVVAVVAGAGGGTLAALVTPWAQWAVDKRRRRAERRAEIIDGARALVHERQDAERSDILVDPRYLAIRPYIDSAVEERLRGQHTTIVQDPYGTHGNPYLGLIRDEADRLSQEWGL